MGFVLVGEVLLWFFADACLLFRAWSCAASFSVPWSLWLLCALILVRIPFGSELCQDFWALDIFFVVGD